MSKNVWTLIQRWLTVKIGVEVRCCLSIFLMLFFYCVWRLLGGSVEANIWHIAQMIAVAYLFGWVQALLHEDFDRMDRLGLRQWAVIVAGGAVYGLTAWLGGWFEGSWLILGLFVGYMIACGLCTVWIFRIKRAVDARLLNEDLRRFQERSNR